MQSWKMTDQTANDKTGLKAIIIVIICIRRTYLVRRLQTKHPKVTKQLQIR